MGFAFISNRINRLTQNHMNSPSDCKTASLFARQPVFLLEKFFRKFASVQHIFIIFAIYLLFKWQGDFSYC